MKEKSLFDVWIRMKPFLPAVGTQSDGMGEENCSPGNPKASHKRSRSKSPRMSRTPIADRDRFKLEKKPDYKAFHAEGGQILLEELVEDAKGQRVNAKSISFPHIIEDRDTNVTIFRRSLEGKIDSVFDGCSFTLLTYGISGSGKSHTIFGSQTEACSEKGLLFYFMQELFARKKALEMGHRKLVSISTSFIEIYNEQVRDLLADDSGKKLAIVESPFTNGVLVPDLTSKTLTSFTELNHGLQLALSRRVVCPNVNNNFSSRSHLIVEVIVNTWQEDEGVNKRTAKVRFVDLAGSEKVSLEAKDIIQEGANINKSLLSLTNCINILSDGKKREDAFIPYRNSKLTRLLKDSLGGDTPVLMIVCISPNSCYIEETLNSLKYAQKAKKIKEHKQTSMMNLPYSSDNYTNQKNRIELLEKEVRYLKGLIVARNHDSVPAQSPPVERQLSWIEEEEDEGKEEEFDELLEALIENVEDLNVLRQNIAEIDSLIVQNDAAILDIQQRITNSDDYQVTQKMYKDLKMIADKLEENLDLKENALAEVDKLNQTIKCTKLALRKLYSRGRGAAALRPEEHCSSRATFMVPGLPAPCDDPMISSTRDQKSLLEEIRRRDAQIASLTLALRNLSKFDSRDDLGRNHPALCEKENYKTGNSLASRSPNSGLDSANPYETLKDTGLAGLELSLLSKEATTEQVLTSLHKLFKPAAPTPAQATPASSQQSRGLQKQKLNEFESSKTPSHKAAASNIDVAYHQLDYYSSAHQNMNSTNPMSLISSSETREHRLRQVLGEIEPDQQDEEDRRFCPATSGFGRLIK